MGCAPGKSRLLFFIKGERQTKTYDDHDKAYCFFHVLRLRLLFGAG